jgi:hypothetical protein
LGGIEGEFPSCAAGQRMLLGRDEFKNREGSYRFPADWKF